nr:esterase-like activity of phytase family protein [Neorhizobium sp. AL 9.2.2]
MKFSHAPARSGGELPCVSSSSRPMGLPRLKLALSAAAIYLVCGALASNATEIGTTTGKACPLGACSAGISFSYLGEVVIPTGHQEAGVEFGGISGLDYDPRTGRYLALSDDRAERGPVRVYELEVDVDAKGLHEVSVLKHIPLRNESEQTFEVQSADPEAIRIAPDGIYWTSEGGGKSNLPPSVRVSSRDGGHLRVFDLPEGFAASADGSSGIRDNLAFEALAVLPSGDVLVALEASLQQDGPKPGLMQGSLARMIQYDAQSGRPRAQYIYPISPIPEASVEGEKSMTGLSEMIALEDGWALTVERSFAEGVGNTIKLFMIDLAGATNASKVLAFTKSKDRIVPIRKTEVLDLNGMGLQPDNIEAMAVGRARDGTEILLLAADNNFSKTQKTQFLAFKIIRAAH